MEEEEFLFRIKNLGTSLVVQWLRLCPSNAGGASLTPGWGIKIPQATGGIAKKKEKEKNKKLN